MSTKIKSSTPKELKKTPPSTLFQRNNPLAVTKKAKVEPIEVEEEEEFEEEEEDEEEEQEEIPLTATGNLSIDDIKKMADTAAKSAEFDLFSDLGQVLVSSGIPIIYEIRKNGMQCATENHPFDWNTIQHRYKGGNYHVILKRQNDKGSWVALKHQTRVVLDPYSAPTPIQGQLQPNLHLVKEQEQAPTTADASNPLEQLRLVLDTLQNDRRSTREEIRSMMPIQDAGGDKQFNLLMEMMRAQNEAAKDQAQHFRESLKEMSQTTREMVKELSAQIKEVARDSNKKDDTFGLKDILAMQIAAEDRTERRMQKFIDMREEIADSKEPGEKPSLATKLIDGLLPALGPLIQSKIAQSQVPQMGQTMQAVPEPIAASAHNPPKPQTATPVLPQAANRAMASHLDSSPPSRPAPKDVTATPIPIQRIVPPKPAVQTSQGASPLMNATLQTQAVNQDKIADLLAPVIGQSLMSRQPAPEAAKAHAALLQDKGVPIRLLTANFSREMLISHAHKRGVPNFADSWLNEYYDSMVKIAAST